MMMKHKNIYYKYNITKKHIQYKLHSSYDDMTKKEPKVAFEKF